MDALETLDKLMVGFLHDQAIPQPDVLWHYTNAAGVLGIFRSGKLWATNTAYLNDASEIRYARSLVLRAIYSSRSGAAGHNEHEMLNFLCDCIGSDATRPVFVASFSAEKMSLASGVHTEVVQEALHSDSIRNASSRRSKRTQARDSIFTSASMMKDVASYFASSSSTACFTNTAFSERRTNQMGQLSTNA